MSEPWLFIPKQGDYDDFKNNLIENSPNGINAEWEFLQRFICKPGNKDKPTISEQVNTLNKLYKTRIPLCEQSKIVADIMNSDFDKELGYEGYGLVEYLRYVKSERTTSKTINHFSFATKYCYHCRPNKYPIYDSVNMRVMSVYYGYEQKNNSNNYEKFVECYSMFCKDFIGNYEIRIKQHGYEGFYIDKFIQAIGGSGLLRELLPR